MRAVELASVQPLLLLVDLEKDGCVFGVRAELCSNVK